MTGLVYLSSSTIPAPTANSIQVMKTCEAFALHGAQVALFAQLRPDGDPFAIYDCRRPFDLVAYPDRDRLKLPLGLGRRVADRAFRRQLRRLAPDILFGRSLRWLTRALPTRRDTTTLALELHTPPEPGDAAALFHALLRRAPDLRLVVITEQLRQRILELAPSIPAEQMLVAPDAADPALAEGPARTLGAGFHLGYIGGLYPGCGLDLLGHAISGLERVVLHVVGGSAEEIASWRQRLPADAAVTWHGRVPYRDVGAFLRSFDVIVAPYGCDAEGHAGARKAAWMSPLKIFEAMAAGRAILASDLPVLREVLRDGIDAWLLPSDNPHAWRGAIAALRVSPTEGTRLGAEARTVFLARYSWDARVHHILSFLAANR